MSWLKKITGGNRSLRQDEKLQDAEIQHGQWTYTLNARVHPDGTTLAEFTEDIFVNPDQASPVAAILVTRNNSPGVSVEILPRPGGDYKIQSMLQDTVWSNGCMASMSSLSEEAAQQLPKFGIANLGTYVIWGGGAVDIPDVKQQTVQRFQKFVHAIQTSPLISENPEIRAAMVSTMKHELASVRQLMASPEEVSGSFKEGRK